MRVGSGGLSRSDVPDAFDAGADTYDQLVGANPGYHTNLRLSTRRIGLPGRGRGPRLIAVDAARGMLNVAQAKSWPPAVRFVHARVEELDEHDFTGPFDGIFAPYLLRRWRTRNTTLYRQLWPSVLTFDGAARFRQRLCEAGFTAVHSETMPGSEQNTVHTFVGKAPQ